MQKRLHDFVAHLFSKLCTKFHHNNARVLWEILQKNILVSFFSRHSVFIFTQFMTATCDANYVQLVKKITKRLIYAQMLGDTVTEMKPVNM